MANRKRIDSAVETRVLTLSARRCCMCFYLEDNFAEQEGQIAHVDHDRSNSEEDNLAYLCLKHHSLYDSRTSQHKNYTLPEVKAARSKLYGAVAQYKPCEWLLVLDGSFSEFDRNRVEALVEHLRKTLADPHLTIKRVGPGSIRLHIESSEAAFEKMVSFLKEMGDGAVHELLGYGIKEIKPTKTTAGTPSADRADFFDDFSDPTLARYYELTPGIGNVFRRADGLHYEITRAPDGPASAADYLSIDSLGRPQSPTARVLFHFPGAEWTLETCVEYDFRARRNGRTAYLWLVQGGASERYNDSIALVRGADLDPDSQSLTLQVYELGGEPRSIQLARTEADRYWLRVTRAENRVLVSWSTDGQVFETMLERSGLSQLPVQTLVINSSSFAGGASFLLRSLRLSGARPDPAPQRPPVFAAGGSGTEEISAADIVSALQAGRDIDLRACAIAGSLDLGQVTSPIASNIRMQDCRFTASLVATNLVKLTGSVAWLNCQFGVVRLSNVEFDGPLSMVGCRFAGDTRFIATNFRGGANFSGSAFSERPFFRVAHAVRPMSFYHADFLKGADLSSASFDDLSLSDIRVEDGSLTLYRSEVTGTLRLIATLQRDPQPLGRELELSEARFGSLIISAGSRLNRGEYTGPARWDLGTNVYLRRATIDSLELYNVHFGVLDLSGAKLRSKEIDTATFTEVVGGWPVETEFYSCFISYSSKDATFASRLHAELEKNGVRCWYAPEDIKIGEEFRQTIDEAIREYDKLLLVLSEHSVRSSWVQDEVEASLERERRQQRQVLFPIRLDDAVTRTHQAWAAAIRRRRHIGDFTNWRDPDAYEQAFQRLLRDLKAHSSQQ